MPLQVPSVAPLRLGPECNGTAGKLCVRSLWERAVSWALLIGGAVLFAAEAEELLRDLAHLDLFGTLGDAVAAVVTIDVFERFVA